MTTYPALVFELSESLRQLLGRNSPMCQKFLSEMLMHEVPVIFHMWDLHLAPVVQKAEGQRYVAVKVLVKADDLGRGFEMSNGYACPLEGSSSLPCPGPFPVAG